MEANKRHGNAILIEENVGMWTVEKKIHEEKWKKKCKRKGYIYKNLEKLCTK